MTQTLLQHAPPAGPATHDRAEYRFDCPELPDTFYVLGVEATEALNEPYRTVLRLRAEHEATDGYQLLGRDVSLTITLRGAERWLRGIVDRVTVDHDGHAVQTCTVVVVPALQALSRTVDTRIFQDLTALEIVERVLAGGLRPYGRSFDASAVDAGRLVKRDLCVQYRESTLDFVHRLLEEEGIGYYFQQQSEPEVLVLFDDNRSLARAPSAVQFGLEGGEPTGCDRMISFAATLRRTATGSATRDYDWRLGARGTLEHKSTIVGADLRRPHEVYEHGADRHHVMHEDGSLLGGMADAVLTSIIGSALPVPIADRLYDLKGSVLDRFSESNTEDRGRVRREALARDAQVFDGVSFLPSLSAGLTFELAGHPGPEVDGEYFVVRVTHESGAPSGAERSGEHSGHLNYHNRVHCLPRGRAWRPDRKTAKPRIDGVQTATVTGPPGMDVYTDPYGRIRVRFPWDRAAPSPTGHDTCWLRVSQAWAGPTAPAFLFVPRVGMEVLVTFLDGDPDRPLAIGCVYNGDNATPALLPAQATKSIIRTRSIPHGAGYNELSFEDAAGLERVFLRAERDLGVLVRRNHDLRVQENERISVGGTRTERVETDQHVDVGRHYRRSVGGDGLELTMGNLTRTVDGVANESFNYGYHAVVDQGSLTTAAPNGEWRARGGLGVTVSAGSSALRMTDDEQLRDQPRSKGMTLTSFGSIVHLTEDRIELKVGESSIVITPELVQINGRTLPIVPGVEAPPADQGPENV